MTLFQVLPLLYSVYLVNFKGIISIYLDKLCFFTSFHINKRSDAIADQETMPATLEEIHPAHVPMRNGAYLVREIK